MIYRIQPLLPLRRVEQLRKWTLCFSFTFFLLFSTSSQSSSLLLLYNPSLLYDLGYSSISNNHIIILLCFDLLGLLLITHVHSIPKYAPIDRQNNNWIAKERESCKGTHEHTLVNLVYARPHVYKHKTNSQYNKSSFFYYLLSTWRFDPVQTEKFSDEGIFIGANMIMVFRKHP